MRTRHSRGSGSAASAGVGGVGRRTAKSDKDKILEKTIDLFLNGFGVIWSLVQINIFHALVNSILPRIYLDEWEESKGRVMAQRAIDRIWQEILINMGRRNGKTWITSGAAAAFFLMIPGISIAVFSVGKRQAELFMTAAVEKIKLAFSKGTHVKKSDYNVVRESQEMLVYEHPLGGKQVLGCYPGSSKVSEKRDGGCAPISFFEIPQLPNPFNPNLVKMLTRGLRVPSKNGIILCADAADNFANQVKQHYSKECASLIHTMKRLYPTSIFGWLPRDVIDYIGSCGDYPTYLISDAVKVVYILQIHGECDDIKGFDDYCRIDNVGWFKISFWLWESFDHGFSNRAIQHDEIVSYVNTLLPCDLFDGDYSIECGDLDDVDLRFGDSGVWFAFDAQFDSKRVRISQCVNRKK